ncbi:hypothetical protein D910_10519 [Dendroctonus ponderosae]|uniref:Uncharacterized protein n=1 Tax=Dendroctonus ponderosae TaxID=77166 RepID=U4UL44_DENPD|nr:hypothetical protein D910_10519 [Dendroctonus ponderosae]
MNKNVTISDLNVEIQGKGNGIKQHLLAKVGIGIIEFFLASIVYCYGIILSEYVFLGVHEYREGIWSSILYICCWSFTDPFSRFLSDYFEDRKSIFFRYLIGISAVLLFMATMVPDAILTYMIFGAIISNLVSTQLSYFAVDKLDMDPKVLEVIRQVSRALSLFIMPQFVWWLITIFSVNQAKLVFASVLLNIVPAALLIPLDDQWKNRPEKCDMTRYQTIGDDEPAVAERAPAYLPVATTSTEPQYNNQHFVEEVFDQGFYNYGTAEHTADDVTAPGSHLSHATVQSYYMNMGINILPGETARVTNWAKAADTKFAGIPEENEDEDQEDLNYIDPKRLSVISSKLEELNLDQIRRDSIREVFTINELLNEHRPEPINTIEYISNFKETKNRVSVMDELKNFQKSRHCFHCNPYRKYVWTRRLRTIKDFFYDNIIRPIYYGIKNIYFYPSLTTKVVTSTVSTLYITLAPFMAMEKSWKQSLVFSTENVTFLLTYVAFAWCFFLVTLPLVLKLSHEKMRLVFVLGLIVNGTSLWILSQDITNDVITISSLLFGFGYGIITFTEKIVYKSSMGMRPWHLVRGPLEILSGLSVLLIYYLIYFYRLELSFLLFMASLSYYANAGLWLCLPFFKYFTKAIKRVIFDHRSQHQGFF